MSQQQAKINETMDKLNDSSKAFKKQISHAIRDALLLPKKDQENAIQWILGAIAGSPVEITMKDFLIIMAKESANP